MRSTTRLSKDDEVVASATADAARVPIHPDPLRVVLLDEGGAPVTGARVTLEARQIVLEDSLLLGDVPGLLEALVEVTLGDGEVCFDDLAEVTYRVAVAREGHVGRIGIEARPGEDLVVTLREGRSVSGQVIDGDTNEPVVGAMVRAQGIDWRHREVSDAAARTDADGRFVLLGLGDHAVEIRVTAPWYPAFALDLPPDVPSSVLVMRRVPRGVAGRVIEPTSEKPIEGVRVRGGGGEAVTDTEGNFLLMGIAVPAGQEHERTMPVAIQFEADGYESASFSAQVPVDVSSCEAHPVDAGTIELASRRAVTGILLDPEGHGLAGALLVLAPAGSNVTVPGVLRTCVTTRTEVDGRFRFPCRPTTPGALHLSALVPGFAAAVRAVGASDSGVTLRLQHGLDVTFAVPGPGAAHRTVILDERGADGAGERSTVRRRSGRSDAHGRVAFQGLRPGHVRVSMPGVGVKDLEVGASSPLDITFASSKW